VLRDRPRSAASRTERHRRPNGGAGSRTGAVEVEQRDLCRIGSHDTGQVQQDEHGDGRAEETVHLKYVLDPGLGALAHATGGELLGQMAYECDRMLAVAFRERFDEYR